MKRLDKFIVYCGNNMNNRTSNDKKINFFGEGTIIYLIFIRTTKLKQRIYSCIRNINEKFLTQIDCVSTTCTDYFYPKTFFFNFWYRFYLARRRLSIFLSISFRFHSFLLTLRLKWRKYKTILLGIMQR